MRDRVKNLVRAGLFLLALLFLILGIAGGGFKDTRNKAVRICYECIGIG